jgi:hypothetical protein
LHDVQITVQGQFPRPRGDRFQLFLPLDNIVADRTYGATYA